MKPFLCIAAVLMFALPLCAYQAGQANRANFGPGPQLPSQQRQFRAFSNYNNRSWGQGVQTNVAGTEVAEFKSPAKPSAQPAAKKAAAAEGAAKPAVPAATQPSSTTAAQAALPAQAAAMMQQVQGMMNRMGGMPGAAAGQANASAPTGQAAPAMPAGMPDLSALMGGMMPGAQPTAPAQK